MSFFFINFTAEKFCNMGKEIERKFLVKDHAYRELATESHRIRQGYLSANPDATVRVRILDDKAYLTVKSRNNGAERGEWEYEIPLADGEELLGLCTEGAILEKTRYLIPAEPPQLLWEVDEFSGAKAGLVVAEIELPEADTSFEIPDFIGAEVTGNPAYYNSSFASRG